MSESTPPDKKSDKTSDSPTEELGDYERPTMYFEKERSVGVGAGAWLGVGFEFALFVVLFFLGGKWLDGKFGWDPWGAAMGGLLGALMGMASLIRRVTRMSDDGPSGGDA